MYLYYLRWIPLSLFIVILFILLFGFSLLHTQQFVLYSLTTRILYPQTCHDRYATFLIYLFKIRLDTYYNPMPTERRSIPHFPITSRLVG